MSILQNLLNKLRNRNQSQSEKTCLQSLALTEDLYDSAMEVIDKQDEDIKFYRKKVNLLHNNYKYQKELNKKLKIELKNKK